MRTSLLWSVRSRSAAFLSIPAFSISSMRTIGLSQMQARSAIISARVWPPLRRFKLSSGRTGSGVIWFAMVNTSSGEISGWFRHWQWSFKNSRTLRSRTKRMLWERWAMSSFERLERSARVTGTLFMRMPRLLIPSPFTSCSMSFMRRLFPAPVFPAMAQSSPGMECDRGKMFRFPGFVGSW